MDKRELGKFGEDTAARLLVCEGYEIIERNYRCKFGEIDIIASKDNELYFIEVKTRSGHIYGRPCEAITYLKEKHIKRAAVFYLNEISQDKQNMPAFHFNAVEIVIEHMHDIF